MSRDTHPPCDQLPNVTEANAALSRHQDLVEEIKALGDDITVEVGKPCPDDENRGLVMVSYGSRSEHDSRKRLHRVNCVEVELALHQVHWDPKPVTAAEQVGDGLLLAVGTIAFLNGWITVSRDTHPPCDQLPNVTEANAALSRHQDLVEEIKALGDDITPRAHM